jgi:hypothetical protein
MLKLHIILVILAFRRWKQEDGEFEASLGYLARSSLKKERQRWALVGD